MAIRSCTVLLFVLASCHAASNSAKQAPRPEKMELKAAKQEIAELKLTIKGMAEAMAQNGGAMSPDVKSGMRDTADQAEQERSSPLLEHDGAREGLASSRSLLGAAKADGTCPEGTLLSARNFKVLKNGTKVPGGPCVTLPKLEDFKIGAADKGAAYGAPTGVLCSESGCRTCSGEKCDTSHSIHDWVTMNGLTKPADKIACSRICLMGGSLTEVKDLQRYNNPTSKTGERSTRNLVATKVDSRFATKKHRTGIGGGMSSPICSFYKTTMCTNSTNCDVHKEVSCVAIVPASIGVGKYSGGGSSRQLAAYRNECKHAINPCGNLPMLV